MGRRITPNSYIVDGVRTVILLPCGKITQIDTADLGLITQRRWHFSGAADGRGYVKTTIGSKKLPLHQLLLFDGHPTVGIVGDHRDGDTLNNRRSNLRPATAAQNQRNRGINKKSVSGFKGVTWQPLNRKWRVIIVGHGVRRSVGMYRDPVEAAKAYDSAARELHGEFARLNFPEVRS